MVRRREEKGGENSSGSSSSSSSIKHSGGGRGGRGEGKKKHRERKKWKNITLLFPKWWGQTEDNVPIKLNSFLLIRKDITDERKNEKGL